MFPRIGSIAQLATRTHCVPYSLELEGFAWVECCAKGTGFICYQAVSSAWTVSRAFTCIRQSEVRCADVGCDGETSSSLLDYIIDWLRRARWQPMLGCRNC